MVRETVSLRVLWIARGVAYLRLRRVVLRRARLVVRVWRRVRMVAPLVAVAGLAAGLVCVGRALRQRALRRRLPPTPTTCTHIHTFNTYL